jgi:hypothetical protein
MGGQGLSRQDGMVYAPIAQQKITNPAIQGVREMSKEELSFLQVVSLVTSNMGCTIDNLDIDGRNITIYCPKGKRQEIECAIAIGNIMEGKPDARGLWALCGP